jgi:hypothetical protein
MTQIKHGEKQRLACESKITITARTEIFFYFCFAQQGNRTNLAVGERNLPLGKYRYRYIENWIVMYSVDIIIKST